MFNCTTPPVQRVQSIQDGSLVEGALEELDTGPYEALASSVYVDISQVVFASPTLADVSYTLRFHSDPQLTFPMIGQAIVIDGGWRVSYSTVCAAIQLDSGPAKPEASGLGNHRSHRRTDGHPGRAFCPAEPAGRQRTGGFRST